MPRIKFGPGTSESWCRITGLLWTGTRTCFGHFCCRTILNWNSAPLPGLGRVKLKAWGPVETELRRIVNAVQKQSGYARPGEQLLELRQQLQRPIATATAAMERDISFLRVHDDAPALADLHNVLMQCFGSSLVPPDRNHLFRARRQNVAYVGQDYLLQDGVLEAINEINLALIAFRSGADPVSVA